MGQDQVHLEESQGGTYRATPSATGTPESQWVCAALKRLLLPGVCGFDLTLPSSNCTHESIVKVVGIHRVSQILQSAQWFAPSEEQVQRGISEIAAIETAFAMKLREDTVHVSQILLRSKIRHLVVKGVALAFTQGRPLTARGSGDIDVWVHPKDFAAAQVCLLDDGWTKHQTATSHLEPGDGWRYRLFGYMFAERSYGGNRRADVDLHWQLTPGRTLLDLDFESAWRDSVRIAGLDGDVRTLCPRDTLRHVSSHGLRDGWPTFRHLVDVIFCSRALGASECKDLVAHDEVVRVALKTACLLDPSIQVGPKSPRREERLVAIGINGVMSVPGKERRPYQAERLVHAIARFRRSHWLFRIQNSWRGRARILVGEVLPLKILFRSRNPS